MIGSFLFIAAIVTFGAIACVMLPEIGKRTDFLKAPPSIHARNSKIILPLGALFVVLILLASQAKSWGWP